MKKKNAGFTLVELMITVAIVGVLSALAIYSFRRYTLAAEMSEAKEIVQDIAIAEVNYKSENWVYLGCSGCSNPNGCFSGTLAIPYPQNTVPLNGSKMNWNNPGHPDYGCWQMLNVNVSGPVRFGYSVVAGMPGAVSLSGLAMPSLVSSSINPWFVAQAVADRDNDGILAAVAISSWNSEPAVVNDTE